MPDIVQVLILGLLQAGTYALLASGLALIIGVMNVLNFAHGEFMVIPALTVWVLWSTTGVNPLLLLIPVALATLALGALTQRVVIERVIGRPEGMALLVTFGLALLMRSAAGTAFSLTYRSIPFLTTSRQVGDVTLPDARVVVFIVAIGVYLATYLMLRRTQFGRAIRAVAGNPEAALACGVDVRHVRIWAFGIGSMQAAIAGGLLIFTYPLNPESGFQLILKGVVAQMLGGITSYVGALFGAVALGEIEVVGGFYSSAELAQVFVYASLLVLFLYRASRGSRGLLR